MVKTALKKKETFIVFSSLSLSFIIIVNFHEESSPPREG